MEQEEFIHFSLTKAEKLYTTVERAFGYRNKKNEYMLEWQQHWQMRQGGVSL